MTRGKKLPHPLLTALLKSGIPWSRVFWERLKGIAGQCWPWLFWLMERPLPLPGAMVKCASGIRVISGKKRYWKGGRQG